MSQKKQKPKGMPCNKSTKNTISINFNTEKFYALKTLRIKVEIKNQVDCRTWLHVPYGKLWSTSSDNHQVVKVMCACQIYGGSICHRLNV